jgi:GntP family gluconate:H+ symporter
LLILAVALAIVITGVLAFRLHAFLTLIVAALAVAALTPSPAVERYELSREAVRIDHVAPDGRAMGLARPGQLKTGVAYGVFRLDPGAPPVRVGSATVTTLGAPGAETALDVVPDAPTAVIPGAWVATDAAAKAAARASGDTIGERVAAGFGRTALDIGILIAMASILGGCLMAAHGAERIVVSLRNALGPSRTPFAFLGSGLLLGIPMFAEAVFYLLLPLAKAMWRETRRNYLLFVMTIVAGATMTHSLVPPTPGPLFVAQAMGIDIALMMQQGLIVSTIAALAGYGYARYADRRWPLEVRSGPAGEVETPEASAMLAGARRLPPLVLSLLPILLPVILISADSALEAGSRGLPDWLVQVVRVLGDKNLALTLSAASAILLLVVYAPPPAAGLGQPALPSETGTEGRAGSPSPAHWRAELVRKTVKDGVIEAGEIILVIAAGGALGTVLRQAGMAELAAATVPSQKLLLIPIAWAVTALVRIAQGSATVAMITAVGIVGPIALAGGLPYHPVYVAVAIGAGSKIGMWMNDSGFWVIAKMSGMTEAETLRSVSVMVFIEGCVGLVATLILAWLWPLA